MSVAELSVLALRSVVGGASKAAGFEAGQMMAEGVAGFLSARLKDPSQLPVEALRRCVERSWQAIEIALAGESLWRRLDRAEDRGFRDQVRAYLDAVAAEMPEHDDAFRRRCLADLRAARREGVLLGGKPGDQVARDAAAFLRYVEPLRALSAEWELLDRLALQIHQAGYEDLARLVCLRVAGGASLLALAVRFFFHQEMASDPRLFQGLTVERIDQLGQQLEGAFVGLNTALEKQGQRLEALLESIQAVVVQTHGAVLDVQQELRRQGEESQQRLHELYQAVLALQARFDLAGRELRPHDSLSIRSDGERQSVRQVVNRYRAVPATQRSHLPALLNAIGKLEVAAGEFDSAQQDFHTVAGLVRDDSSRGEAHFNGYLAALEQGRYDEALQQLRQATACDRARFALFAPDKYEPLRILGAGGFGVAFHCRYRPTGGDVAVKVLMPEGLEHDVNTVFQEAGALDSIQHPAIIRLRECDFADAARQRPYLVMEYFDGQTVEEFVRSRGPMAVRLFLVVFQPVAEALQAAHERNVLHRDIKPANLLVRPGSAAASTWQVKVTDFGLALKQSVLTSGSTAARSGKTVIGRGIAGSIDYAAPEQMGKLPGARVGTASDVYGFGRTACFALFGTPNPLRAHWQQIPEALADLLEACLHEDPRKRLNSFAQVVQRLKAIRQSEARPATPAPATTQPVPEAHPVNVERIPTAARVVEAELVRPVQRRPEQRQEDRNPRAERQRRPAPVRWDQRRLPRLLSALLGLLYLAFLLGTGVALMENSRTSRPTTTSLPTYSKPSGPGGYKQQPMPIPASRGSSFQFGNIVGMLMAALLCGGVVGIPGGLIIRSLRGWLFVVVVSLAVGFAGTFFFASPGVRYTPDRMLGELCMGMAVGAILAWAVAVPIKGVLWLIRSASSTS